MPDELIKPQSVPILQTDPNVNFFGLANYRNQNRKFGIKLDDRRRHMYIVGKTGMGKTTLLENMVLNDIYAGHGVGYVDPHGDTAEKILNYIPSNRINDVVYFNPSDIDFPIGFNILETIRPEQKHLVVSGLMGVFKKIWPDVWSARMEYILNNTILALLDFPGTTLLGINRLLADEDYRRRVVRNIKDPVVKSFWQVEFAAYSDKYRQEAVAPIQNKIGQFLSASIIRNIVAQVKSRINIREIMDQKKIFIMNLSKGRIGEDSSRLLGGMLITKIQLSAMERVDIPETERKDFFLYVDEFQNFATESFANILSEARKYRLALTLAHQYMEQLDETVLAAVIGNVGTTITFRVGSTDAEILAKEFAPVFVEEDLINLPKFQIYLKLMIDGVSSRPFSAMTLAPIAQATGSFEKVVKVSRERYAAEREQIEDKIARWSGMVIIPESEAEQLEVDPDEAMFDDEAKKEEKKEGDKEEEKKEEEKVAEPVVEPKLVIPSPPVIPAKAGIQSPAPTQPVIARSEATKQSPTINNIQPSSPVIPAKAGIQSPSQSPRPITQPPKPDFKKKNKHKKKNNFAPHQGEAVLLGNPNDRGISLSSLQSTKPAQQPAPRPVIARSEATKQSPTTNNTQSPSPVIPSETRNLHPQSPPVTPPPPSDLNIGFIPKQAPLSQSLKTIKPDQVIKIDEQQ